MSDRLINFSAGPAMLPKILLERAQQAMLDWQGHGFSIIEANHRGPEFKAMLEKVEHDMREVCHIPSQYRVLFMLAPARAHFAAVPLNLFNRKQTDRVADYLITGLWSSLAATEAQKYLTVNTATDAEPLHYAAIAEPSSWQLNPDANYVYYADNETVHGLQFPDIPDTGSVPLVSDMTSSFLAYPVDVSRFGIIVAGVQKNIAAAGLSLVIIREDLLGLARADTPSVWNYELQDQSNSLLNTNSNFSCFTVGLMLDWVREQGGVVALHEQNKRKAAKLYDVIDNNDFYQCDIDKPFRSTLNVVFSLADPSRQEAFLSQALQAGMMGLKGHRLRGGLRASLYNPISESDVDTLAEFMISFAKAA